MTYRLDQYLVIKHMASSRTRAKSLIKQGDVTVDDVVIRRPAHQVSEGQIIRFNRQLDHYVGRAAYKLLKAIDTFNLQFKDCVCLDVGASTGGFSEVMLRRGARRVYALDVGRDQLHDTVKKDVRVVDLSGINIRQFDGAMIEQPLDYLTIDVSFISLGLVLPHVVPLMSEHSEIICLVKPQFEAGRAALTKRGVIRDQAVHRRVLQAFSETVDRLALRLAALTYSPIQGAKGNREYLAHLTAENKPSVSKQYMDEIIRQAFQVLG